MSSLQPADRICQSMQQCVLTHEPDGTLTFSSPSTACVLGLDASAIASCKTWQGLLQAAGLDSEMAESLLSEAPNTCTLQATLAVLKGRVSSPWIKITALPFPGNNDTCMKLLEDVSAARAQAELQGLLISGIACCQHGVSLSEIMPATFWDPNASLDLGRVLYANPALEEMTGLSLGELQASGLASLVDGPPDGASLCELHAAMHAHQPSSIKLRCRDTGQGALWTRITATPISLGMALPYKSAAWVAPHDSPCFSPATMRADRALSEPDVATSGLSPPDQSLLHLSGDHANHSVSQPCPDAASCVLKAAMSLLGQGMTQGPLHVLCVHEDITEQVAQEMAWRLRDTALSSCSEGITIADPTQPDAPLVYVNAAFLSMTGYSMQEAMGSNCRFLQGPDTDREAVNVLKEAVKARRKATVELLNYRKNGEKFWNRLSITPIFNAEGVCTSYIGVQSNITELIHRKEEEQRVRTAMEAKSMFLANLSHEIRTPLNGLMGTAQLLLASVLTPEQRELAETLLESGNSLQGILGDILDFSKLDHGSITLKPELMDGGLRRSIECCIEIVAPDAVKKGLAVYYTADDGEVLSGPLVADGVRMRQVLTNLLSNAIKFTETGEVHVDVRLEPVAATWAACLPETEGTPSLSTVDAAVSYLQSMGDTLNGVSSTSWPLPGSGLTLPVSPFSTHISLHGRTELNSRRAGQGDLSRSISDSYEASVNSDLGLDHPSRGQTLVAEHGPGPGPDDPAHTGGAQASCAGVGDDQGSFTASAGSVEGEPQEIKAAVQPPPGWRVHISVRDTGIGIAPDTEERLFQCFRQGSESMARRYGGTGLGLAISRQLAKLMEGSVWCESEGHGQGCTFHFCVPANYQPAATLPAQPVVEQAPLAHVTPPPVSTITPIPEEELYGAPPQMPECSSNATSTASPADPPPVRVPQVKDAPAPRSASPSLPPLSLARLEALASSLRLASQGPAQPAPTQRGPPAPGSTEVIRLLSTCTDNSAAAGQHVTSARVSAGSGSAREEKRALAGRTVLVDLAHPGTAVQVVQSCRQLGMVPSTGSSTQPAPPPPAGPVFDMLVVSDDRAASALKAGWRGRPVVVVGVREALSPNMQPLVVLVGAPVLHVRLANALLKSTVLLSWQPGAGPGQRTSGPKLSHQPISPAEMANFKYWRDRSGSGNSLSAALLAHHLAEPPPSPPSCGQYVGGQLAVPGATTTSAASRGLSQGGVSAAAAAAAGFLTSSGFAFYGLSAATAMYRRSSLDNSSLDRALVEQVMAATAARSAGLVQKPLMQRPAETPATGAGPSYRPLTAGNLADQQARESQSRTAAAASASLSAPPTSSSAGSALGHRQASVRRSLGLNLPPPIPENTELAAPHDLPPLAMPPLSGGSAPPSTPALQPSAVCSTAPPAHPRPTLRISAPAGDASGLPPPLPPLRILIAEDNKVNQKVVLKVLQQISGGVQTHVVENGLEVLQALEQQSFDLILMDIHMPLMDGLEATRRIVATYPVHLRPRIIALSADTLQTLHDRCREAGIEEFIVKPFRVEDLRRVMQSCSRSQAQTAQFETCLNPVNRH